MDVKVNHRRERIANVEKLRILAACGVASFHTHLAFPRSLGVVGFIVLMLCFCAFTVNKPRPYDLADLARQRAQRLLKPWLFWSVIYGILALAKVIYEDAPFSEVFSPTMFLTGTRIHLWFLPFAFVAAVFLVLVHRTIITTPITVTIPSAIVVGALCLFSCSILTQSGRPLKTPLGQWLLGLPAVPLGFAIGQSMLLETSQHRYRYLWVFSATAVSGLALTLLGFRVKFAVRYIVAVAMVCAAFYWQGKPDTISKVLAPLSYGIYLIHPLVLVFLNRIELARQQPLILFISVIFISAAITWVIKRTPLKQFV